MRTRQTMFLVATLVYVSSINAAQGQETTTYMYDAKGRIVSVARSGGPSAGVTSTYAYDPADNRSNVTISGSLKGSGNGSGDGASAKTRSIVAMPLMGISVIVVGS